MYSVPSYLRSVLERGIGEGGWRKSKEIRRKRSRGEGKQSWCRPNSRRRPQERRPSSRHGLNQPNGPFPPLFFARGHRDSQESSKGGWRLLPESTARDQRQPSVTNGSRRNKKCMPTTCRPPSPAPAVSLLPALSHLTLSLSTKNSRRRVVVDLRHPLHREPLERRVR